VLIITASLAFYFSREYQEIKALKNSALADTPQIDKKPIITEELDDIEVQDLQTYRNEEFGFEIQYPKAFEEFEQCPLREGLKSPDYERLLHLGNSIDIEIKDAQGLDFAEFAVEEFGSIKSGTYEDVLLGIDLKIKESFVVDNEEVVRVAFRACGTCRYGEITNILHNGKLYRLSYFARPSCVKLDFEQFEYGELDVLHQVFSTFQFIEPPLDEPPTNTNELIRYFSIVWGDPPVDSGLPALQQYHIYDKQNKTTRIIITENTQFLGGNGVSYFDRKTVKVTGEFASDSNSFEALFLEIVE